MDGRFLHSVMLGSANLADYVSLSMLDVSLAKEKMLHTLKLVEKNSKSCREKLKKLQ